MSDQATAPPNRPAPTRPKRSRNGHSAKKPNVHSKVDTEHLPSTHPDRRRSKKSDWPLTAEELERIANEERQRYQSFATGRASPPFRELFIALYEAWNLFNRSYFGAELHPPCITIGEVPPRAFGFYSQQTDWGAKGQITIRRSLVWGNHSAIVNPLPALGTVRLIEDMLLHETVHQWQHEVACKPEDSYGGHGACFSGKCNEIGEALGLPRVVAKRRSQDDADEPRCNYWPYNVRPDGYFCEDVILDRILKTKPKHEPDYLTIWRMVVEMLENGQSARLLAIAKNEIEIAEGLISPADVVRRPFD